MNHQSLNDTRYCHHLQSVNNLSTLNYPVKLPDGFEPSYTAYKAVVLPLDDGSILREWDLGAVIFRVLNPYSSGYEPDMFANYTIPR